MFFVDRLRNLPLSRAGDRAPRFAYTQEVEISTLEDRHLLAARSINISRSGLLVDVGFTVWPRDLGQGREVLVRLGVDGQYVNEPLVLIAKVTRLVRSSPDDRVKSVGFQFVSYKVKGKT